MKKDTQQLKNFIDTVISHNERISLWEQDIEDDHYCNSLWSGMGFKIPEEYLNRNVKRIFGTIPTSILDADVINIELFSEEV